LACGADWEIYLKEVNILKLTEDIYFHMPQADIWEKEYRNPKLITTSNEPQLDFKHFIKWLRKHEKFNLEGAKVLDLGSGTGKNSIFLAERGCDVIGMEISSTAIKIATERAQAAEVSCQFIQASIGEAFPFNDHTFDLIIDVVSSNSLTEAERAKYIEEIKRVLKPGGYLFVKALCKDRDKNADKLMLKFPGTEQDTYIMPGTGITERVWTKADILNLYEDFQVLHFVRKSSYTKFADKSYKRYFWLLYLKR
jgi:ubiquinone/menaquinone biosynthesis C-methylase UbiE